MSSLSGEQFELKLLLNKDVFLHEECEDNRYSKLIKRFKEEKVLLNPLIVGKYRTKYILIDGANRFQALKKIGCKTILCQLVKYDSQQVGLKSWYHFVIGISLDVLKAYLMLNDITHKKVNASELKSAMKEKVKYLGVVSKDKKYYLIKLDSNFNKVLVQLSNLNKFYESNYSYIRIDSETDISNIDNLSQDNGLLFIYPLFKKENIVNIALMKDKLPAGISRHSIPNRVLHFKYPIKDLISGENLIQRNKDLNKFIEERIANKKVRLYREPTLIFSE